MNEEEEEEEGEQEYDRRFFLCSIIIRRSIKRFITVSEALKNPRPRQA